MSKKKIIPVWATFFLILGLVILCGLGTWQIQRLQWKKTLIDTMRAAYASDPVATALDFDALRRAAEQDPVFAYGTVHGTFLFAAEMRVGPRTLDGVPGYHLITPLRLQDHGDWVLVNRGWVPLDYQFEYTRDMARTTYTLTGSARAIPGKNTFTPPNNPNAHEWFWIDAATVEKTSGVDGLLQDVMFYAEAQTPQAGTPTPQALHWLPNNNHLSYAIFWFVMAGAMVVIYALRFLRRAD